MSYGMKGAVNLTPLLHIPCPPLQEALLLLFTKSQRMDLKLRLTRLSTSPLFVERFLNLVGTLSSCQKFYD